MGQSNNSNTSLHTVSTWVNQIIQIHLYTLYQHGSIKSYKYIFTHCINMGQSNDTNTSLHTVSTWVFKSYKCIFTHCINMGQSNHTNASLHTVSTRFNQIIHFKI